MERVRGTVKWFNDTKGYGFITRADGKGDVFVHYSAILGEGRRSLTEGMLVQFEAVQSQKGAKAVNVRLVEDP